MPRFALHDWLTNFIPHPGAPEWRERVRRAGGALLGIAFTGIATHLLFGSAGDIPMLVAPMGASAVLLFGASESPLAQPWSIVGGNLVSALVGVACAQWIATPVLSAAVAVALAISAMFLCRCVHPPSGAVALTAVLGGPAVHALGFRFVAVPIVFQSFALLSAALVFHALTGHRYPRAVWRSAAPENAAASALGAPMRPAQQSNAADEPQRLPFDALTCEEFMSSADHAVPLTMGRHAAWETLRRHGVHALPVVDDAHRLVGTVTHHDLANGRSAGLARRLWRVLRRKTAQADETVEAVMASGVQAVHRATPLAHLASIFADHACYEIPVLDDARRLIGVVKHSDMIRWLHQHAGAAYADAARPLAAES
ncbi:HPP family protein [Paraburkholderia silviterrae]|uniref:CBS domain-containing protein n=1 Tax=Paraburkholderia silviterrae TaxID=2528715 RepID=A0A4V2ZY28_9BURK|nr:HPP family protein [Paraburkholderia silviterrae]TDG18387.1 CBS domain-containing protein [Paraburkholderia silviterrae]